MGSVVELRASILSRSCHSQETQFPEFPPQVVGELVLHINFVGQRGDFLVGKFLGHLLQLSEILTKVGYFVEVHTKTSSAHKYKSSDHWMNNNNAYQVECPHNSIKWPLIIGITISIIFKCSPNY